MSFRLKTAAWVLAMTALIMGAAFGLVWQYFVGTQRDQLDRALIEVAEREAAEAAVGQIGLSDAPGPSANAVGPLPKYGVIYAADERVLASTDNFVRVPPMPHLAPVRRCFDFRHDDLVMRAVVVDVAESGVHVLIASPRDDLDDDARMLAWAMSVAFVVGCVWAASIALVVASRLTRNYRLVEDVARRVAAGDTSARVAFSASDSDFKQLADDLDTMIDRLVGSAVVQERFVANAAHELRTPLTALRIELEHALKTARTPEEYRDAVAGALDSGRRLSALADDLLVMARARATPGEAREPVSLAECVADAVADVTPHARERGVVLQVTPCAGIAVAADRRSMARLVRNLLENAVRFSPPEGVVTVACKMAGARVVLEVSDRGPGVASAERTRIFEPFARDPRSADHDGVGLGLSIARSLARSFGGELGLRVEHTPGACFVVELPVSADSPRVAG